MSKRDEKDVDDATTAAFRPGDLVLTLVEGLHNNFVGGRRGQLLRRMMVNVLLILLVEVIFFVEHVLSRGEQILAT